MQGPFLAHDGRISAALHLGPGLVHSGPRSRIRPMFPLYGRTGDHPGGRGQKIGARPGIRRQSPRRPDRAHFLRLRAPAGSVYLVRARTFGRRRLNRDALARRDEIQDSSDQETQGGQEREYARRKSERDPADRGDHDEDDPRRKTLVAPT